MKTGDLVRYKVTIDHCSSLWQWYYGLLLEFDKVQRMCVILDHRTGKPVRKHCSDVQLSKVGYADR